MQHVGTVSIVALQQLTKTNRERVWNSWYYHFIAVHWTGLMFKFWLKNEEILQPLQALIVSKSKGRSSLPVHFKPTPETKQQTATVMFEIQPLNATRNNKIMVCQGNQLNRGQHYHTLHWQHIIYHNSMQSPNMSNYHKHSLKAHNGLVKGRLCKPELQIAKPIVLWFNEFFIHKVHRISHIVHNLELLDNPTDHMIGFIKLQIQTVQVL